MKSVIMVGCAWSKNEVDFQTKDEIWILNNLFEEVPRFDCLFELHTEENINERQIIPKLAKVEGKKIYMQRKYKRIPCSQAYPLHIIKDKFYIPAMGDKLFLTCTVSYMIALAIHQGYEKITLLGIDEALDGEYKDEMPSVLYWLGVAFGKGIQIEISSHSPLLKGYFLYGYEDNKKTKFNEYFDKEKQRLEEIRKNAEKIQKAYQREGDKCIGALTVLEHIQKLTNEI